MKRFQLDGKAPQTLRDIARDVVSNYAKKNPSKTAAEIRDDFVKACENVRIEHIVETEAEYHTRDGQKTQKWTSKEVTTPNGEKLYVSTQWRAKHPYQNFYQFMSVVNRKRWGKIVKVIL